MTGSGCKTCPVRPCKTMNYRGATCAAQRARFGLGDPMTNGERIRAMSEKELAGMLVFFRDDWDDYATPDCQFFDSADEAIAHTVEWLKQPYQDK